MGQSNNRSTQTVLRSRILEIKFYGELASIPDVFIDAKHLLLPSVFFVNEQTNPTSMVFNKDLTAVEIFINWCYQMRQSPFLYDVNRFNFKNPKLYKFANYLPNTSANQIISYNQVPPTHVVISYLEQIEIS
jgi:hypothetical protein